jgi:hypothetical protein
VEQEDRREIVRQDADDLELEVDRIQSPCSAMRSPTFQP